MKETNSMEREARRLAEQIFTENPEERARFLNRVLKTYEKAKGKEVLLIHNPGGWGCTRIENLLQWERSIVEGICSTIDGLGYEWGMMQYFRTGPGKKAIFEDIREQTRFFRNKSRIMAAEIEFITRQLKNLKIIMIGVSQGAAFSNSVAQNLNGLDRLFSIEIGTPFPYKKRLLITKRTLTLTSNGLMPDALMEWNVGTIIKTYVTAPVRWLKYRLQRKRVKFTYCINLPGHDYNWDYPEVRRQIEQFLKKQFKPKKAKNKSSIKTEVEA